MKWKQTHRHREQTCGCPAGGDWGGKDWEFGVSRCKLLHRMDKQQGPTVEHREPYSTSCDEPSWKRI